MSSYRLYNDIAGLSKLPSNMRFEVSPEQMNLDIIVSTLNGNKFYKPLRFSKICLNITKSSSFVTQFAITAVIHLCPEISSDDVVTPISYRYDNCKTGIRFSTLDLDLPEALSCIFHSMSTVELPLTVSGLQHTYTKRYAATSTPAYYSPSTSMLNVTVHEEAVLDTITCNMYLQVS